MKTSNLKVAAYQMVVVPDIERNIRTVCKAIRTAASEGADVIVVPECAVSGYPPLHYARKSQIDLRRIAESNDEIIALAQECGIWVIAGTITERDGKLFNTALVASPNGLAGTYDKMHLIGDDSRFFAPGESLPLFDFGGAPFGVQICYDIRFPEPFRYLKSRGATVVFNLFNACEGATWKVPVLEGTCRCRAAENHFYIVAANAAGPLQMMVSRICDPDGVSLAAAKQDSQEIIYATLDLSNPTDGFYADRRTDVFEFIYKGQAL